MLTEQPPQRTAKPSSSAGCSSALVIGFAIFWIVPIACIRQLPVLTASAVSAESARIAALAGAALQIAIIGLPVLVLSFVWSAQPFRAVFRTWLLAALLGALLLPVHLLPEIFTRSQTLAMSWITLAFIIALLVFTRKNHAALLANRTGGQQAGKPGIPRWSLALGLGMFLTYPWIFIGALGSLSDTFLAFELALLLGIAACLILEIYTFIPFRQDIEVSALSRFTYGGLSAAGVLAILSSSIAFPFGAIQILLLLSLSGLGWVISGLTLLAPNQSVFRRILPGCLMIGLVAGAVLAFLDPDETTLILALSPGELLPQAFGAAVVALLIGLAASAAWAVVYSFAANTQKPIPSFSSALSLIALLVSVIGAALIYFSSQPGLHGDRMFVILSKQADLTTASAMPDPVARRRAVFDTLIRHAGATQAPLVEVLDRFNIEYTPFYLVNAIEVEDNPVVRQWLSRQAAVDRIIPSPVLRPLRSSPGEQIGPINDAPLEPEWNLTLIGADRVWEELGITGEGILIGQSDSGVQGDHPEVADGYRGADGRGDSWFDPWFGTAAPADTGGHGTHTLGSVLGNRVGVAPGAEWIACVNLARNLGNPALYLDCWQFNFAPFALGGDPWRDGDPARGAQVLNNSWGCPEIEGCDQDTFTAAVAALRTAGVFVVVSAGNDGPACGSLSVPPPTYSEVLSVGAIGKTGELAFFSSIGPDPAVNGLTKPDLVAPGQSVLSSLPGSTYGVNSGTSMAGPHVVGVVALMWSANPALIGDIERTEQILFDTATAYTGALPDCPGAAAIPSTAVGYGIVDAYAAVKAALDLR